MKSRDAQAIRSSTLIFQEEKFRENDSRHEAHHGHSWQHLALILFSPLFLAITMAIKTASTVPMLQCAGGTQ